MYFVLLNLQIRGEANSSSGTQQPRGDPAAEGCRLDGESDGKNNQVLEINVSEKNSEL